MHSTAPDDLVRRLRRYPVIVLMTFNEHEQEAVLDKFCPDSSKRTFFTTETGASCYHLGVHGGLDVIQCMSRQGENRAQQTCNTLIEDLASSIKAIIAVGIAFGVDNEKQNIGDVLIAESVFDYEMAKEHGGDTQPRGKNLPTSKCLFDCFRTFYYGNSRTGLPKCHFGTLLSGNKLIDDKERRDEVKYKAESVIGRDSSIGGEMEGVGIYHAVEGHKIDWLIVKAVSDYADGNKGTTHKDEHQKIAAGKAALIVHEVLNMGTLYPGPSPTPRDLRRETGRRDKSAFQRLRFAERAIGYIKPDAVWQAFKGFHTSKDPFSWWLITGGAGTGKSRTALEFCEFLKTADPPWQTGFVSLENTPFEVWEKWRPEQDVLLVIDYAAREFSIGSQSDDNNPHDVVAIVNLLTKRAQDGELGTGRIRLLLLEREYRDRGDEARELDWYKKLDKGTLYQRHPFELDTLGGEALYKLATETTQNKKIWNAPSSLPDQSDFLDKLASLDEKKRPLFAILLAGYLTTKDTPNGNINQYEVLDFEIEQEFKRVLTPSGVNEEHPDEEKTDERHRDLLEALLLSTITGGRLGMCKLPEQHPLWHSGLGKGRIADRTYHFYPLEPDLLGERLVLTGGHEWRIPKKRLIELLIVGWQNAIEGTFDFFTHCAQDFAKTDAKTISDLFLSSAFGHSDGTNLGCAREAVNLVAHFGNAGNLDEARKIFDSITKFGHPGKLLCAQAAFNLVSAYSNSGNLIEAQGIFDLIPTFGNSDEIKLLCAHAAFNLVSTYGNARNLVEAQRVFDLIPTFGNSDKIKRLRAKAAFNLVSIYCNARNLVEARKIFDSMPTFGDSDEIKLRRAQAAFNLVNAYSNAEDHVETRKIFDSMLILGHSDEIKLLCAKAAVNLVSDYGNAGNLNEARKIFDLIPTFGSSDEIKLRCAQAAFNLVIFYDKAGNLTEAQRIFDFMSTFGNSDEINLLRAKAAFDLVNNYGKAGNLNEAQKILDSMPTFLRAEVNKLWKRLTPP